jgi:Flp pilus assembly pilin Flp
MGLAAFPMIRADSSPEFQMGGSAMLKGIQSFLRDEQGGEVLEYALIVGLIVVAAIAAITSVGTKVLARWTSLDSSI